MINERKRFVMKGKSNLWKAVVVCMAFCVLTIFAGCTKTEVVTETSEINPAAEENDTSIEASLPTEEPELTKESVQKEDITMEQIIDCSNRKKLLVEDLMIWNGLQESRLTSEACRQYYYDLVYKENPYRLEFRSDADNTLLFVRLVDMQTLLSIDIRTGNVEHLIAHTVSMTDYLSCDFPEGVSLGTYDVFLGHFGGINLKIGEEVCGSVLILDSGRVNPVVSGGKITKVGEYENNIYHKETEELVYPPVPAIFTLMEVEEDGETTEYYSIYFAEESCNYCYNIRLCTDLFTKEEVLEIIDSVVFSDRAFY